MPVNVGLAADGQPTPALLKKLQAIGASAADVARLERVTDGKSETLFLDTVKAGVRLADGLQKALVEAIARLPIPKVMTYQLHSGCQLPGWDSVQFVRPAHGLVALHGAAVVAVSALGLQAGRTTHGHRFEAAQDPIVIADADSYAPTLRQQGAVIAGFAERRAVIAEQLQAAAAKAGNGLRAIEDEALLDEVTALVERPNVLACQFDAAFLQVPQECLILTMKANQKYFPLVDAAGKLSNRFLVVSNITPDDASAVIEGNERVVRPRLADAKFFFDQDRKKTLESRVPGLAKVVYHNKLGTQGERVERVRAIACAIAERLGVAVDEADQAATLAKADLLTDMVGEFPELQGVMGRYYALHDGLAGEVADAIEDHYKPRFAGDALPRGAVGCVVALADKLETLAGMFSIGQTPTGDKDPFALRRHALGVIRILIEKALDLPLDDLLRLAARPFASAAEILPPLSVFIYERLAGNLREQGYTAQEVDAVLALQPQRLADIAKRLTAVRAFSALPEAAALAAANKRVGNILKKIDGEVAARVDTALLKEAAEVALHQALLAVAPKAETAFRAGDYDQSLRELAVLRGPVDAFFDGVMVNADDPALRANRQGLLKQLHTAMNQIADLSRLSA
jgi:glycyl-tRNA synthetase beta chain